MTVFLAPDLRPFYGGTYFPPVDRHGHPGFPRILQGVAEHYRTNRDSIEEHAAKLTATLQQNAEMLEPWEQVGEDIVEKAFANLSRLGIQMEMSNTITLSLIEEKLPNNIRREWSKELNKEESKIDKLDKFPHFLKFLIEQKRILEYEMSELRITDNEPVNQI